MKSAKEVTIDYLESIKKDNQEILKNHDYPECNKYAINILRIEKVIELVKEGEGE